VEHYAIDFEFSCLADRRDAFDGFCRQAQRSVRRRRQRGAEELYDHHQDSMEWTNLAGNPEYAEIKARLKALVPRTDEPKSPENPD
jgi:hypothetical protein